MPARGVPPDADVVRIEAVFGGVGAKPSHGSLAIFYLRRKRGNACKAIIDARNGVAIIHESNSRTALFSAPAPASAMDPNDQWQRTGKFLGKIKVEPKYFALDALVDQISLGRDIGNVCRPAPRHDRLRCLPTQDSSRECNTQPYVWLSQKRTQSVF